MSPDHVGGRRAAASAEHAPAVKQQRWPRALPSLVPVALFAALRPLDNVWLVSVLLCALLLVVPGVLLLRALRIPATTVQRFPLYVPAAAILVVSLAGLGADLLGPKLGVALPLHGDTSELTTVGVCLALWLLGLRHQDNARLDWRGIVPSPSLLAPLLLPLLAAAGALLLTNGHGAAVAAIAVSVLPVVLGLVLFYADRLSVRHVAVLLFSCALAAEWAYSIRSQEIVGFDISTEVGLAKGIHAAGIWHANQHGSAYGAMLSLTVFPAVLDQMTGISPLIAFKVVYPVITALLPVAIFIIANRFLQRRFAAVAAALLLVQYYFFQQLAQIARQEVGLLFFAGIVALLLDWDAPRGARLRLAVLLGAGLVISHYSSAYFAIVFLALALVICVLLTRWLPRHRGLIPVLMVSLIVVAGGAVVYYGPITHSATNVTSLKKELDDNGFDLFPASSGGFFKSYVNENQGYSVSASQYQKLLNGQYDKAGYIDPLSQAFSARYALKTTSIPGPAPRLTWLSTGLNDFTAVFAELLLLAVALGSLWGLLGKNKTRRVLGVFGFSMIGVLFVFRFSQTLASQYNQTRALLQALLIIAVPAGFLVEKLAAKLGRIVIVVIAVAAFLMFAIQDGATWLIFRGGQPLDLANAGEGYERFYETPAEIAAAGWAASASHKMLLYADEYGGLRTEAAAQAFPIQAVTPQTLDRHAWVYGTLTNDRLGRASAEVKNTYYVTYIFPAAYLDRFYDTMFDDGDSKVWNR